MDRRLQDVRNTARHRVEKGFDGVQPLPGLPEQARDLFAFLVRETRELAPVLVASRIMREAETVTFSVSWARAEPIMPGAKVAIRAAVLAIAKARLRWMCRGEIARFFEVAVTVPPSGLVNRFCERPFSMVVFLTYQLLVHPTTC